MSRPFRHRLIGRPYSDPSETAWDFVGLMNQPFSPGDHAIHQHCAPRVTVCLPMRVFQRQDPCFAQGREARTAAQPTRHPPRYRCLASSRQSIAALPWHPSPRSGQGPPEVLTATSARVRTRAGRIRFPFSENRTVCWTQPVLHNDSRRPYRAVEDGERSPGVFTPGYWLPPPWGL